LYSFIERKEDITMTCYKIQEKLGIISMKINFQLKFNYKLVFFIPTLFNI
jgi:hypothetical protein